jgi:hypothetical protein
MKEENKNDRLTVDDLNNLIKTEQKPKSNINNLFNTVFFVPENESELLDDNIQKVNGISYTDETQTQRLGPAVFDKLSGVLTTKTEIANNQELKIKTGGYE